ncbi:hypothetical protein ACFO0N_04645 [Halobium salinum]|uniref:DUF1102 domain-containing protein n=1 Tax=Halobium salinum TaxID=1364940 RepID=A0ABD5P8L1_9EURY|nr:hypothetical protein [Halobium salinum]
MWTGARATLVVFLAVALVSGPLVSGLDFTTSSDAGPVDAVGDGRVAAGSVTLSGETASLDQGRYGSGAYYLDAPSATVAVESVSGSPMLGYRLRISDLGYAGSTVAFLSPEDTGTTTLELDRKPFAPERVEGSAFRGEVTVFVRADGTERVLYERVVEVEVEA